jgi:hypothetical protein
LLHLVRCEEYLQRYCDGADLTQVEAVLVSSQFFSRKKRLHNYGKSSPCYQWVNHGKSTMSAISNKKLKIKDPPCYQWVNPLFLWAISNSHGFEVAMGATEAPKM